jgi:hypothetical protein
MKQKNFLKIAMLFVFAMITHFSYGQLVTTIDFETEDSGYTLSASEGSTFTDVFNRIDRTGNALGGNSSFLFAIEDLNTVSDPSITLDQIDVTGSASFTFSIDMISHHYNDWDNGDELKITYSVDGGADQNLMWVQNTGQTFNDPAAIDTDFNGDGDCGALTTLPAISTGTGTDGCVVANSNFATFVTGSIALSSNTTLGIKLQFIGFDSTDEGLYLDNIIVTETAGITDPTVTFDAATSAVNETDIDITADIPVTLTNYDADVTITPTVSGSSTADAADYTIDLTPLTFSADGTLNIPLTIKDDADFIDETIIIDFTVTTGTADLGTSQHTVTITDDEVAPTIGFDAATSSETETDATFNVTIPVTVSSYSGTQIDVSVVASGTAEGGDFTLNTASLSFTADGSQNISLDINDDVDTDEETVILTITETSAVTGLVISQNTHTVTITDDETPPVPSLIITEVADPDDEYKGRFVEIYNNGATGINLATEQIYIAFQANGGGINSKALSGTLAANEVMIIGNSSNINTYYSFSADEDYGTVNGNGDDGYFLYHGGNHSSGTLFDSYGVLGQDGSGQVWEYENSRAVRLNPKSISPNATWTLAEWTITSANVADMTPGALENEFRYDGDWKPRDVYANSSATDDVYISSSVTLTDNLSVTNFEIETDQIATINSGGSLIVSGTSTGNVTYNTTLGTENWYLASSPVVGETYDDTYVTANSLAINGTNNAIGSYATADNTWSYMQTGASGTFTPGAGYSVRRATAAGSGTISFTGTINTSDAAASVITGGTNSFNLIGNPFTAYLNSASFLTGNTANLVSETIWVWNQASGNYETKVTVDGFVLAPTQGFFINAASAANLIIAESYQATTGSVFQKTAKTEVKLMINDGTNNRFAKLYYLDNATTGFDNGYDGKLFSGVAQPFAVYTHLVADSEDEKYQVQSLPNSDFETMVIPVGISADASKEITFTADALNVPSGLKVFLEDRQTNTFTRLDEVNANYKVTLTETLNGVGRFYMHTTESVMSTEDVILNSVRIFKTNASTLKITGLPQGKTSFYLYNILGKEMMTTIFTANGNKEISLSKLAYGIYLAKIQTEKGAISKKIILK